MPAPPPHEIARLCEVWLTRVDRASKDREPVREVVNALRELLGADGAAVSLHDERGFIGSGTLLGAEGAELSDGPDETFRRGGRLLIRRAFSSVVTLFSFREGAEEAEVRPAVDAAAQVLGSRLAREKKEERGFGELELLAKLGEGGMAEIHLARRMGEGEAVALKRIRKPFASERTLLGLFWREAQAASTVQHPNVVRILEYGVEADQAYMVMEYLRGASLAALSDRMKDLSVRLGAGLVLALALEYCAGLEAVHHHGIIHCDVSPQNLFVTFEGVGKVIDFGISRLKGARSLDGNVRGKLGYLAPERVLGDPFDHRADLYGLGAVMYEGLLGPSVPEAMYTLKGYVPGGLPPMRELDPSVPAPLAEVVARALSFEPGSRQATAAELAAELRRSAGESGIPIAGASELAALMRDVMGDLDAASRRLVAGALAAEAQPGEEMKTRKFG
ncbi:MAG: serine/threonine protein kinase [Myxococcales bacterium]|nr:serine/threonine protein kinase [Myxococcales bacterium]